MQRKIVVVDYRFPYPGRCSQAQLMALLRMLAKGWHGWERFPWRVTRHLHRFLDELPVNFHYLMIHRCLQGFAAHLVLTERFVSRNAVLEMMVRERFEVVGVLRVLLIDALRAAVKWSGVPYILDASGPEDGHKHLTAEEIERRRVNFRKYVDGAVEDFVAILNHASLKDGMSGEIYGRALRTWAQGDLPKAVSLPVQAEEAELGTVLHPCEEEVAAISDAGRPIPTVVLEAEEREGSREGAKPRRGEGTRKVAAAASGPEGAKVTEIIGDFKLIRFRDGHEIVLATKHKARAVLRHIWERLTRDGTDTFYAYQMRESFNAQYQGDREGKRWESDRIREDLFRGSEADFDRMVETLDRASDHFRMKILGAVRR